MEKDIDKNIDKDIELLREMQLNGVKAILNGGMYKDEKAELKVNAIENALLELEKKELEIKRLREDYLLLQKSSEEYEDKLEAELETWEKIAEKLAEEVLLKTSFMEITDENIKILIDQVRKEVLKDE